MRNHGSIKFNLKSNQSWWKFENSKTVSITSQHISNWYILKHTVLKKRILWFYLKPQCIWQFFSIVRCYIQLGESFCLEDQVPTVVESHLQLWWRCCHYCWHKWWWKWCQLTEQLLEIHISENGQMAIKKSLEHYHHCQDSLRRPVIADYKITMRRSVGSKTRYLDVELVEDISIKIKILPRAKNGIKCTIELISCWG